MGAGAERNGRQASTERDPLRGQRVEIRGEAPIAVEEYSDAVYAGELHLYADCAGVGTAAAVLAVANDDGSVEAMLEFQFPGGPDRELLDQMLAGFVVGT